MTKHTELGAILEETLFPLIDGLNIANEEGELDECAQEEAADAVDDLRNIQKVIGAALEALNALKEARNIQADLFIMHLTNLNIDIDLNIIDLNSAIDENEHALEPSYEAQQRAEYMRMVGA